MKGFLLLLAAFMVNVYVHGAAIRGTVVDKNTQEPLIGAAIQVNGTTTGTVTDLDGYFELAGLRNGTYQLTVSYISYITQTLNVSVESIADIRIEMLSDDQQLNEVVVVADAKKIQKPHYCPSNGKDWSYKRAFPLNKSQGHKTRTHRKLSAVYQVSAL